MPRLPNLPSPLAFLWRVLRQTVAKWMRDDAFTHAAALSYYAIFSIAPVMVLSLAMAGSVFGWRDAKAGLLAQWRELMGPEGAKFVQTLASGIHRQSTHGAVTTAVGLGILLFGASGVFVQLERSLNNIWGIPAEDRFGFLSLVRQRFLSFALVIGVGVIFVALIGVGAAFAAAGGSLAGYPLAWKFFKAASSLGTSLALFTLLFAILFKVLPQVELRWSQVWIGGAVSAVLFDIGKWAVGLYLAHSQVATAFGAAGSLALLLLWVFYGALILFLGAEFTYVYTRESRARQGLPPDPPRRGAGKQGK